MSETKFDPEVQAKIDEKKQSLQAKIEERKRLAEEKEGAFKEWQDGLLDKFKTDFLSKMQEEESALKQEHDEKEKRIKGFRDRMKEFDEKVKEEFKPVPSERLREQLVNAYKDKSMPWAKASPHLPASALLQNDPRV